MKVVLIYNINKQESLAVCNDLAKYLYEHGIEIMPCGEKPAFSFDDLADTDFSLCDLGIVLGGDGTILATARVLSKFDLPFFGVNMGQVGFLSSTEKNYLYADIDKLLVGDYCIKEKLMLTARINRLGLDLEAYTAFGDFVINSDFCSRSITFEIIIDDNESTSYNADGVIIASPTGATGYSFSAGGPILMDNLDVIQITPVCPHSFFSRPILTAANSQITIVSTSPNNQSSLTVDGYLRISLQQNDQIIITRGNKAAKIIQFGCPDYLQRIKTKLFRI